MTPDEIQRAVAVGALTPQTADALLGASGVAAGVPAPDASVGSTIGQAAKTAVVESLGNVLPIKPIVDAYSKGNQALAEIRGDPLGEQSSGAYKASYEGPPPRTDVSQYPVQTPPTTRQPGAPQGPNFAALGAGAAGAARKFDESLSAAQAGYGSAVEAKGQAAVEKSEAEIAKNEAVRKEMERLTTHRNYAEALDENDRQAERMAVEGAAHELRGLEKEAAAYKIDPERKMRPLGAKILAALATGLGQYAAVLGRTENTAAKIVRQAIDDDIAAQQQELDNKRLAVRGKASELGEMKQRFGDAESARLALASKKWAYALEELKTNATKYDDPIIKARAKEALAQAEQEKATVDEQFTLHRANVDAQSRSLRLQAAAQQQDQAEKAAKNNDQPPPIPGWIGAPVSKTAHNEAISMAGDSSAVMKQIDNLAALVQGPEGVGWEAFPTDVSKRAKAQAQALRVDIGKNILKLGVLSDADLDLLNDIIGPDPTRFRQGAVGQQLDAARNFVADRAKSYMEVRGYKQAIQERPPAPIAGQ